MQAALKFARCMRAHGVPKFPDPDRNDLRLTVGKTTELNLDTLQFISTVQVCMKLVPGVPFEAGPQGGS
jgi:hypothetical protein